MSMKDSKVAEKILMGELKELQKENWVEAEARNGNLFLWDIALVVVNPTSMYHGAYLKAELKMPRNYPMSPPEFKFCRAVLHPNIYKNGKLCISILHPPGEDELSGEKASERWSPAQRIFTVLISILSLLDDAETSSPANVDASVMLRNNPELYKMKVQECVQLSKQDIPMGFVMPTAEVKPPAKTMEDDDFWHDSDEYSDVGSGEDNEDMEFDDEYDSNESDIEDSK